MDLQTRKLNLIAFLAELQDEKVLSKIENFISLKESTNGEVELKRFTKKELISRIKKSEQDFIDGNYITQEELELASSKW